VHELEPDLDPSSLNTPDIDIGWGNSCPLIRFGISLSARPCECMHCHFRSSNAQEKTHAAEPRPNR
jgi:hypothetical protein